VVGGISRPSSGKDFLKVSGGCAVMPWHAVVLVLTGLWVIGFTVIWWVGA
jgi:hypothetical protein